MRVLRFFAQFTFICNIAFLLFAIFSYLEQQKSAKAGSDMAIEIPYFKGLIVTLGFSAIFINIALHLVYVLLMLKRRIQVPVWLVLVNLIFLLLQIYYFFFYKK